MKDDAERRTVLGRALTHVPALVTAMSLPLALLSPEIVRGFTDEHFHDAWRFVPAVAFAQAGAAKNLGKFALSERALALIGEGSMPAQELHVLPGNREYVAGIEAALAIRNPHLHAGTAHTAAVVLMRTTVAVLDAAFESDDHTATRLVDHLVVKNEDYRDLFTTRRTFVSGPLGMIYRIKVEDPNGWTEVELPKDSPYQGILTLHGGWLSTLQNSGVLTITQSFTLPASCP